ncbi:TIGR03087 family PEP-CTERM/XrtA system glycosyltransferase [Roseomonas populi]|uniref:TIGR03087 family PEP-CTERM/XrtA system glycosyltransferase n=1 Tax=Roseomonas populi TaxID=3121582 RepID=A0ABT1XBH1_9PROT|nr:TIGR03087 family PEP-CTERM/XrtA system glycosyltransferase [Roseomonas pecuniae]MCR0985096.1 TIGR03087 family PEP-CTERM/XrtA system glycosyltransferase [Roseomonas pecuniae]
MRPRLLFLCHRIPYPPDKGDKIRAWHMLEHLARRWTVDLGCLVDDPADLAHLPALRAVCDRVECHPTGGRALAAARALMRVRPGLPLTLGWFHAPALRAWVEAGLAARRYDAAFVYSSSMAPYVMGTGLPVPRRILDLVDVDSTKWAAYAEGASPPMRQVWAREARTLLSFERRAAAAFDRTLFVSREERDHFAALAPESAARLDWVDNGVDLGRFDPALPHANPYRGEGPALVFTGTMNYRPNVEAVTWFAQEVMPRLRAAAPHHPPEFHIVGASPSPAVRALAALPGVNVTGAVPDTRPYIAHAAAAVAPLRIARGIQNKVLEAMALARPVIASPQAFEGVRAVAGRDILVADGALATASAVADVLAGRLPGIGEAARAAVARGHDWSATLGRLDALLAPEPRLHAVGAAE